MAEEPPSSREHLPRRQSFDESVTDVKTALCRASRSLLFQSQDTLIDEPEKFDKTPEQRDWILNVISDSKLFRRITFEQSEKIAANFFSRFAQKGESIISEGDVADRFFVVE